MDPKSPALLGLNWGSLGVSCNQNNHSSSGAYVTCIYCGLNVKINMSKTRHGCIYFAFFCFVLVVFFFFCVCGRQKPEDPKFEPHGWWRLYMGAVYKVWDFPCLSVGPAYFCWLKCANLTFENSEDLILWVNKPNWLEWVIFHHLPGWRTIAGRGGTHILRHTGTCRSNGSLFHRKSLNMMGPIF